MRSQSLSSKPIARSLKPVKAKTIKKHIPGPHGLITIEVPVEEEEELRLEAQRAVTRNFRRVSPSQRKPRFNSFQSFDQGSTRSMESGSRRPVFADVVPEEQEELNESKQKKAVFADTLTEVDEDKVDEDTADEGKVELDESKELHTVPVVIVETPEKAGERELEELRSSKQADEEQLLKKLDQQLSIQQDQLSKSTSLTFDFENDLADDSAEPPSTAKSNDTANIAQSSFTTDETLSEEKPHSMAQTLRSKVPNNYVNSHSENSPVSNTGSPTAQQELPGTFVDAEETTNILGLPFDDDRRSSIYSSAESDADVPQRSALRQTSTKKSALKYKASSSSVHLADDNNPAALAYLSLTTAENTRLNALNTSAAPTAPLSVRQPPIRAKEPKYANGHSAPQKTVVPQRAHSPPRQAKVRPASNIDGIQSKQSPQLNGTRPLSMGPRQNQQLQRHQPMSSANAAAVNAVRKPEPVPAPPERKSSFEKERSPEASAFKRMSLRDPPRQQQVGSNMAFYRDQAGRANGYAQHQQQFQQPQQPQQQQQQQPHPVVHEPIQTASNFRSRFNDSDSDGDDVAAIAPPKAHGNGLRKPQSSYNLRSASQNVPSPAKSIPDHRMTRYFSESEATNLGLGVVKGPKEKEPKKRFGKLRKLFGRDKSEK